MSISNTTLKGVKPRFVVKSDPELLHLPYEESVKRQKIAIEKAKAGYQLSQLDSDEFNEFMEFKKAKQVKVEVKEEPKEEVKEKNKGGRPPKVESPRE